MPLIGLRIQLLSEANSGNNTSLRVPPPSLLCALARSHIHNSLSLAVSFLSSYFSHCFLLSLSITIPRTTRMHAHTDKHAHMHTEKNTNIGNASLSLSRNVSFLTHILSLTYTHTTNTHVPVAGAWHPHAHKFAAQSSQGHNTQRGGALCDCTYELSRPVPIPRADCRRAAPIPVHAMPGHPRTCAGAVPGMEKGCVCG